MILRGLAKLEQRRVDQQRAMNHELAGWVSFAYHAPKDMPKLKLSGDQNQKPQQPTEAGHDVIRGYFKSLERRAKQNGR